jgi:hypothetical protein
MEDIDIEKICDVITFLQDNEQYGDDWGRCNSGAVQGD